MRRTRWRMVLVAGVLAVALLAHTGDVYAQGCSGSG